MPPKPKRKVPAAPHSIAAELFVCSAGHPSLVPKALQQAEESASIDVVWRACPYPGCSGARMRAAGWGRWRLVLKEHGLELFEPGKDSHRRG